jgi:hypothetical protein
VVHLFSRTADGFLLRLWLDVLGRFDPREFRFTIALPSAVEVHPSSTVDGTASAAVDFIEVPALANLKHPAYFLRSHLSLGSRFSGENVHILHSHFPGACVLAGHLGGPFSRAGHVASFYSFAGPWRSADPPPLLLHVLRRTARHVERIVCLDGDDETRILDLGIAKKYQTAMLPLPIPAMAPSSTGGEHTPRARLAEDLDLPVEGRWAGAFLPSSSRRELRNLLMDLAVLAEAGSAVHVVCLVPALRLSDVRSLLVRLRLGDRFHVPGDLRAWERLVPHLELAVFPRGSLAALAAALLALGVPRPVWTQSGLPWMHLLPGKQSPYVTFGQAYRMNDELQTILAGETASDRSPRDGSIPAETRPDAVAERLQTVYRDVLAEKIGGTG